MNRKTIHQPLETFVILPYNDYKLLCQKIEKAERGSESPSLPKSADLSDETVMNESSELKDEESVKSDVKKDLTKAAVNMALDTLKGEDIKSSAKTHLKQASKDILESANKSNNNKNRKRKRVVHHKTVKSKRKRERLYDEDI